MNVPQPIPFVWIAPLLFVAGAVLGALVNWAATTFCTFPRPISPWSRLHPADGQDSALDRVPILGWWRLRRKFKLFGPRFWLRPLVVELGLAAVLVLLYWWEVVEAGPVQSLLPPLRAFAPADYWQFAAAYLAHVLLLVLMLATSLIDLDEQTVPDELTVTGTLLALVLAAAFPQSMLPITLPAPNGGILGTLDYASPNPLPAALAGAPNLGSLAIVVGGFLLWSVALLPRPWRAKRGLSIALRLLFDRMVGYALLSRWIPRTALGCLFIGAIWWLGGPRWTALTSAVLGMLAGGAVVWAVRIVGWAALRKEAMGFGDVTLLAMIGAFVGWQAALVVFFFAPFFAIAVGIVQVVIHRDQRIPFGPHLCSAAAVIVLFWGHFWNEMAPIFSLGLWVPLVVASCVALMGVILALYRAIVDRLVRRA